MAEVADELPGGPAVSVGADADLASKVAGEALVVGEEPPQTDLDRSFVLDDVGLALTSQRRAEL